MSICKYVVILNKTCLQNHWFNLKNILIYTVAEKQHMLCCHLQLTGCCVMKDYISSYRHYTENSQYNIQYHSHERCDRLALGSSGMKVNVSSNLSYLLQDNGDVNN